MLTSINRRRDFSHKSSKEEILRTPKEKVHSLRLYKNNGTEEKLASAINDLQNPDCEIERVEFTKIRITDKIASMLVQGLNTEKGTLKEIVFAKCRMSFGSIQIVTQQLQQN